MAKSKWKENLTGTKRKRERRLRIQRKKEIERNKVLKKYEDDD